VRPSFSKERHGAGCEPEKNWLPTAGGDAANRHRHQKEEKLAVGDDGEGKKKPFEGSEKKGCPARGAEEEPRKSASAPGGNPLPFHRVRLFIRALGGAEKRRCVLEGKTGPRNHKGAALIRARGGARTRSVDVSGKSPVERKSGGDQGRASRRRPGSCRSERGDDQREKAGVQRR